MAGRRGLQLFRRPITSRNDWLY